ncbi:cytochrome P450 [Rivibacter subsaxonicus]|uniref:Cytochrome P450 n=1 Tax=Rivibacter subsaxonicus TaxID=457575 RepID=A0A4Q7VP26_9BURK|nr:cytochrome P450 [Rivibacter subsaxonicus]RZT97927.1 cytochrome P450 [Rivibacter subsaxonicus]
MSTEATPTRSGGTPGLRRLSELPGPRRLPLLGQLGQFDMAQVHRAMEGWARLHGPLFQVHFGPQPVLVVADHEAVARLLRERPERFGRSSRLREITLELGGVTGLFAAEGEAWRQQRKMVMSSFSPGQVRAYFPALLGVTQRLQSRWARAARDGARIDLQADLKRFTVDAIAGLAFGTEVNTLESDADPIQRHLDLVLAGIFKRVMSPLPYWRWVRRAADRELEQSMAAVQEAIGGFVAQGRARLAADPARRAQPPNLLEAMLVAAERGDAGVSERDVAGNVSTMLFAGEDTTANTLAWTIHLLHRHPPALARASAEVRALAPQTAAFTPEAMAALEYLEACALEAMRLKPVAPFLGLEALHDTEVEGVAVPAGGVIWCVLRHDSVDERHFPNPDAFEPGRWLAADAAAASGKRVAMPFGSGPRICPGRYLALLEIKLALAVLLANFEIEGVDTPDGREAAETMHFTMNPVGLSMRLRERG